MKTIRYLFPKVQALMILFVCLVVACGGKQPAPATEPAATLPVSENLPEITSVTLDRNELPRYESLEMIVEMKAAYSNPFDAREVKLQGVFTGPNGQAMNVPGFWDGKEAWRIRFTPSAEGEWSYRVNVSDANGESLPSEGRFSVTSSSLHGWVIPGNAYDPSYSSRYLVQHDGTPFYGVGHCDALNILVEGFDIEDGVRLFDTMKAANENYVVWWPLYSNSFISDRYDRYSASSMKTIDLIVSDAQKEGIFLVFTVWDHPNLRDETHSWNDGKWSLNGFSKLGGIDSFFTSKEAWAWQENLYRYIIARWGYSPAIGMWLTVSEINGTNSYDHTDDWHKKVNDYFVSNDPYRHPTTASGSGEWDWPAGHQDMDMPQVHLYDFDHGAPGDSSGHDTVGAAKHIADWTQRMLSNADKPNWIGEFGIQGDSHYPELFHNSIWAALGAGASMTPAEWNSGGQFGEMTPAMNADISRLAVFVHELPLAEWNPETLQISSNDPHVRGWGVAGNLGGLFWLQDFSLEGQPIDVVRSSMPVRSGVEINLTGLATGTYTITPYDTWLGVYLDPFDVTCMDTVCKITLPEFKSDMAFKIVRK
jgi:hypothetical protein